MLAGRKDSSQFPSGWRPRALSNQDSPLVTQLRDLHVVRLEQLSRGAVDGGDCELVADLCLQQALLPRGDFSLRFEHEKNRSRA